MKNLFNSALRCNTKSLAAHQLLKTVSPYAVLFFYSMIMMGVLLSGCQKENSGTSVNELPAINVKTSDAEVLNFYTGLPSQTSWELQQARAATAKYRNIKNAIKNGYFDNAVDVKQKGHHYIKTEILDAKFDIRQPEILV